MRNSDLLIAHKWDFASGRALARDYFELGKPRVVVVMLVCAAVGMALSVPGVPDPVTALLGLLGIGMASMGAAAFNHLLDQRLDKLMLRTSRRPVAEGRVKSWQAALYALALSISGISLLWIEVNPLTALLTAGALLGYAVVYTAFLKWATPQNITIGGLAGAAPPLLGWTAMTGQLHADALLLVLIIFAWTPPHFWALAIHKKEEYAKAGVPMLPVTHGNEFTRLQIWLYGWLTVAATLMPVASGMSSWIYLGGALLLNIKFMYYNWKVWKGDDPTAPLSAFWFSIRYLLYLFCWLLFDHYFFLVV
ncbi:protoheme IX farnesyltransferase [Nitrincola tibetensis]|uniref:Protoheme IX farnesyltransferase n=1 Tax=Nitrincola tibetensis TaxID=2219697 RepID=A0A364NQB8_9GAMM|nr:heme o synthase [Nitrincola tibetensis]RAU19276.1 protoheme IX farnesyltransferase [Nitrincola tibetensis]